jgi:hypothetical protein
VREKLVLRLGMGVCAWMVHSWRGLRCGGGFVCESRPQMFVTTTAPCNPAGSMFISSDRTWPPRGRESTTSASACLSSAPMDLSPATAVTSGEHPTRPRHAERGRNWRATAVTSHERSHGGVAPWYRPGSPRRRRWLPRRVFRQVACGRRVRCQGRLLPVRRGCEGCRGPLPVR